jgi:hypothetical protein
MDKQDMRNEDMRNDIREARGRRGASRVATKGQGLGRDLIRGHR